MSQISYVMMIAAEILLPIVIIVVIVLVKRTKKRKEKEQIERARSEKEAEEKRLEQETVVKIKSNKTISSWVEQMATIIEEILTQSTNIDWEFQFRSYTFAFLFGIEIQDIYLQHTRQKLKQDNYQLLGGWEFAKFDLPELKEKQLTIFDKTVAEMTVNILVQKGID